MLSLKSFQIYFFKIFQNFSKFFQKSLISTFFVQRDAKFFRIKFQFQLFHCSSLRYFAPSPFSTRQTKKMIWTTRDRCYDFKMLSPKNSVKKLVFWAQIKAELCKILIII
jgi:hypothetical protein